MNGNKNNRAILPVIVLNARPGAGKSELIKFLSQLDPEERKKEFHIGNIRVIDDFPYLWRWFEEDAILEEMGKERLFTDQDGYFKYLYLWDLLIRMINLEYEKFLRDTDDVDEYTTIIEFSRGVQHGGYSQAYPQLSEQILQKAAILYVNVSWEESLRKNRQRFNPDKPDSILEHGLPDKKLEFMYSKCDFKDLSSTHHENITIRDIPVPYSVFENEDDVTTNPTPELGRRLKECLDTLFFDR